MKALAICANSAKCTEALGWAGMAEKITGARELSVSSGPPGSPHQY